MALNLKSTLNSLTTTKIEENSVKNVSLKLNSKFFSRRRRRNFLSNSVYNRASITMGIRAVESFDSSFQLQPENEEVLVQLLQSETFRSQVSQQPGMPPNASVTFTGILFQPVPWSVNSKFGMPQEYEKYLEDKENFIIVNVPPNFMFQAKIFKPSRLCAIFKKEVNQST